MQLKGIVRVVGMTYFDQAIDGQAIDSGTIYGEVDLDPKQNGFGVRTKEYRCASSEIVKRLKHLPLPFVAEVTMTETATKKSERSVIVECKPVQADGKKAA